MSYKVVRTVKPPIIGYQNIAYPLSIIASNEVTLPWIYNNYIQLCCCTHFKQKPIPFNFYLYDFTTSPWLITQTLQRETFLASGLGIVDFLVKNIDLGYAIALNINEFFIPDRSAYQKHDQSHDILVYGYHLKTETLKVMGFKDDMTFGETEVGFENFSKAFADLEKIEALDFFYQIYLYKFNENSSYSLNLPLLINSLEEYLYSIPTANKFAMLEVPEDDKIFGRDIFGMDTYSALIENIELAISHDEKPDIRPLHILWEHKNLMVHRVQYLLEHQIITDVSIGDTVKNVSESASHSRNLLIKHYFTRDKRILNQIIDEIVTMKTEEEKGIAALIAELKGVSYT